MTSRRTGPSWFQDNFGFAELNYYSRTKQHFTFQDGLLTSQANGRVFYAGPFETPTVQELQQQYRALSQDQSAGVLNFRNIVGHPYHLHLREENADAVFQAGSQFNCLAPADPQMAPDFGITRYCHSGEQASECAMACPAATVFRNYMVGQTGQGGNGKQLDCLEDVAKVVGNDIHMYWKMQNGFCLPDHGGIASLSRKLAADPELLEQAKGKLRVGVHEDTEVVGCQRKVCQVLCAAVPVTGIRGMRESAQDWEVFARAMLDATYEATFCQAAILAAKRQARVKLFLTTIGLGCGCPTRWIVHAINTALDKYAEAALDVMLVHYYTVPPNFAVLAEGRPQSTSPPPVSDFVSAHPGDDSIGESGTREKLMASFGNFDVNGDGVIDKEEFRTALQRLDPKFFTDQTIEALFKAADASREGVVHYPEFVAWLSAQKSEVVHRVIEEDPGLDDTHKHVDSAALDRARALCVDMDADNDGAITKEELYRALRQEFPDTLSSDLDDIVESADLNGDGVIQYDEFLKWMLLPQDAKVSFEDSVRQSLLAEHPFYNEGRGELLGTRTSAEHHSWESSFLLPFVHLLLDRFSTANEAELPRGGPEGENSVTVHIDLARRHVRQRQGDFSAIRATAQSLGQVSGEQEEVLKILKVLSDEYSRIFVEFVEHIQSKPQGSGNFTLRCPIIPVCDMRNRVLKQAPERVWSAIALALARLNWRQREILSNANFMLYIGDSEAALEHFRDVLQGKLRMNEEACRPPQRGVLMQMQGDHTWIRKDNTAEARLLRLQTFVRNQHIICKGHYSVVSDHGDAKAPEVRLHEVTEMISQTRLFLASQASPGGHGQPRMRVVLPHEWDIGLPGEMITVMRIAKVLAQQGHKVAAVNAASAYHVGGGVASGGRHALEEAWCSQSTLYQSLISVESETHELKGGKDFHQHVPTTGVIVSPAVELFRDATDSGYGLLDEPTKISCVVSVAMFNRNPSVSDSPLDSPSDLWEYVSQTCQKLQAMVSGALSCGATTLVVPDVGCGVFMNSPALVGSCLAKVLREYSADLDLVVISASKPEFMPAIKTVLQRSWSSASEVDDYLMQLATDAAAPQKMPCKYGQRCKSLWNKAHTDKYSHPDAGPSARSGAAVAHTSAGTGHSGRTPLEDSHQVLAGKDKPICRYGETCYQKSSQHLREFRHPWADGTETPEERQARLDETLMHKILDDAKGESWLAVFGNLAPKRDMVNTIPPGRSFALIHYAAYQKNAGALVNLVEAFEADATLKSGTGETVSELFRQARREVRARSDGEQEYDRKVLIWLQRMETATAENAAAENAKLHSNPRHHGAPRGAQGKHADAHHEQEGPDTIIVECPTHEHFAGEYVEDEEEYYGEPVYTQKPGARSRRQHRIYFSRVEKWGWVINPVTLSGQVVDRRPQAYLGGSSDSSRRRKPWDLYVGEEWKIFTEGPGGGRFTRSAGDLTVRLKPK